MPTEVKFIILVFGKSITRSNLAKSNERRNYRIFEEFAYYLIDLVRKKLASDDFEIEGKVYTLILQLSIYV